MRRLTVGFMVGTAVASLALWSWLIYAPQHDHAGRSCGSWHTYKNSGGSPQGEDDETCADLRIGAHNLALLGTPLLIITGTVAAAAVEHRARASAPLRPIAVALLVGTAGLWLVGLAHDRMRRLSTGWMWVMVAALVELTVVATLVWPRPAPHGREDIKRV